MTRLQLGHYDSGNRAVAKRHVQWAKQAGSDFFMVSWINPTGREDHNFKQVLLPEISNRAYALLSIMKRLCA